MEYKNGYLLTDKEHDLAIKHNHEWTPRTDNGPVSGDCECGAMKIFTHYGWRVYIAMSPNRGARLLELTDNRSFWSKVFG